MEGRGVAFYCVADSDYFVGLVALVNSLRLNGHDEPVYVLDRGLLPHQRRLVEPHVTLVAGDEGQHPILSKTHAPLRFPAETMILVDSDMIVTRSLSPLIDAAASGRVVAFADAIDRFVPEWQSMLDLPPLQRGIYVNAGFFGLPREPGLAILERAREAHEKVTLGGSRLGRGTPNDPFYFPDQDVWNAVLAGTVPPEELWVLENRLAPFPPFDGIVLEDGVRPRARYENGEPPFFLHCISRKPWLAPTPRTAYTELMKRMLFGSSVPVRVSAGDVPRRLRTGRVAQAAGLVAGGAAWFAARRGRLGIRPRLTSAMSELRKARYSAVP